MSHALSMALVAMVVFVAIFEDRFWFASNS